MPEGMYFNLKYSDDAGFTAFFDAVVENVNQNFHAITEYNERFNVTSFVLNFLPPQQDPMGRLHASIQ
jgi:hypothetical protein